MYFPTPHKASNHQTPPHKTMPHLFSHPEKLYWITSKPFLIFCSVIWGAMFPIRQNAALTETSLMYFSQVLSLFSPYLILIFLSVFPSQYFQIHFQLIFLSLCPFSKSLFLVLFPFVSILFLPVSLSLLPSLCYPMSYFPFWALSSDLLRPCSLSLPSSLLELVQRSRARSLLSLRDLRR